MLVDFSVIAIDKVIEYIYALTGRLRVQLWCSTVESTSLLFHFFQWKLMGFGVPRTTCLIVLFKVSPMGALDLFKAIWNQLTTIENEKVFFHCIYMINFRQFTSIEDFKLRIFDRPQLIFP